MPFIRVALHSIAPKPQVRSDTLSRDTLSRRMRLVLSRCLIALAMATPLTLQAQAAAAPDSIRIAALKYGTGNWELDVIRRHQLDQAQGFELDVKEYAGTPATLVALLAGDTDLAINDWLWVARQRSEGRPFTFAPYSTATGALVVPKDSAIHGLADLKGKRLGIAGGPLDKNWLILRALSIKQQGTDLAGAVEPVFGAPPLVGEQLKQGRVDAVVTYWHYAARLTAAGFTPVLQVKDAIKALGIDTDLPMIGYCFDETWAAAHRESLLGFLRAAQQARTLLRDSDSEWKALRPLMEAPDEATFIALRDGYRAGIPTRWGAAERAGAQRLFESLREVGGSQLAGTASQLPRGTFWDGESD
jgi:NitT/TauT family transport system substrate-binding protein